MEALQPCPLTQQEWYVVHLMAHDHNGTRVADVLCISRHTLYKHTENVRAKLGVTTMMAAVRIATENRWIIIEPPPPGMVLY